ncbi:MAG: class 1 fructose-bisphosphatase [Anaeromyxobacter sp.]
MIGKTTFAQFVIQAQRGAPEATGDLSALLHDVETAVKAIAAEVGRGAWGERRGAAGTVNVQGEVQQKLDLLANDLVLSACGWGGHLAGMASEELAGVSPIPVPHRRGKYLLAFDPLDGSSNVDVNITVGTIFSILRRPGGPGDATEADFLQPGSAQVAAGYALYGPSTMLVVSLGNGVHGFTLERELGDFVLTHPDLTIPPAAREFAINASNERHWEAPVKRYVEECRAGKAGPREADFNMRWIASFVAEAHRILLRGGVFLYPRDTRDPSRPAKLRLLYEAAPIAFLVEQAGGAATDGRTRLLDLAPAGLHARVPVVLGSREEVERIARYHDEHDRGEGPFRSPLFGSRSLFTT